MKRRLYRLSAVAAISLVFALGAAVARGPAQQNRPETPVVNPAITVDAAKIGQP